MSNATVYKGVPYVIKNNTGTKRVLVYFLNNRRQFVFRYRDISDKVARNVIDKALIANNIRTFIKKNFELFLDLICTFKAEVGEYSSKKAAFSWLYECATDDPEQLKNMVLTRIKERS